MVLDFDLNDPLPCEDNIFHIPFCSVSAQDSLEERPSQSQLPQAIIDLDALDEDVVPSSPRSFYEARRKHKRDYEVMVENDEDTLYKDNELPYQERFEDALYQYKRRRTTLNSKGASLNTFYTIPKLPSPSVPSQPAPLAFSCPVCIGELVKATTTKCGHIFCEKCIKTAIKAQHKCPTCRQKLNVRSTFRIYLPDTC